MDRGSSRRKPVEHALNPAEQNAKIRWMREQLNTCQQEIENNYDKISNVQKLTSSKKVFDDEDHYDKIQGHEKDPLYARNVKYGSNKSGVMIYGPKARKEELTNVTVDDAKCKDKQVYFRYCKNFCKFIHFEDEYLLSLPTEATVEVKPCGSSQTPDGAHANVAANRGDPNEDERNASSGSYIFSARVAQRPLEPSENVSAYMQPNTLHYTERPRCPSPVKHDEHGYLVLDEVGQQKGEKSLKLLIKINASEGDQFKELLQNKEVKKFISDSNKNQFEISICDWEYEYNPSNIKLSRFGWYHGNLDKEEAKAILAGQEVGTFLVRDAAVRGSDAYYQQPSSSIIPGMAHVYTMDFIDDVRRHQKLRIVKVNNKYQFMDADTERFDEVWQLVLTIMQSGIEIKDRRGEGSRWKRLPVIPYNKHAF